MVSNQTAAKKPRGRRRPGVFPPSLPTMVATGEEGTQPEYGTKADFGRVIRKNENTPEVLRAGRSFVCPAGNAIYLGQYLNMAASVWKNGC